MSTYSLALFGLIYIYFIGQQGKPYIKAFDLRLKVVQQNIYLALFHNEDHYPHVVLHYFILFIIVWFKLVAACLNILNIIHLLAAKRDDPLHLVSLSCMHVCMYV